MKIGTCGLLAVAGGLALGPPNASAATSVVDSNWNLFSSNFSVYAQTSGGQALSQAFTLDEGFTLDTLSFYGKSESARLYIINGLSPTKTRSDVFWSVDFSDSTLGWHTLSLDGLTLGAGEYYLVMESDLGAAKAGTWARAVNSGRVGLGDLGTTTYEAGQFAASQAFTTMEGASLTLRITGEEASVPAPGGAALAGLCGLAALRRRRR